MDEMKNHGQCLVVLVLSGMDDIEIRCGKLLHTLGNHPV